MSVYKCERCGANDSYCDVQMLPPWYVVRTCKHYRVCYECYCEWYSDGYGDMWLALQNNNSSELADKLVLDFLGKLGE